MAQQYVRTDWAAGHQRVVHRMAIAPQDINVQSCSVFASVREWDRNANAGHTGDARMYVCNTVVGASYVDVWIQIDWDSDLEYQVSLLVFNP